MWKWLETSERRYSKLDEIFQHVKALPSETWLDDNEINILLRPRCANHNLPELIAPIFGGWHSFRDRPAKTVAVSRDIESTRASHKIHHLQQFKYEYFNNLLHVIIALLLPRGCKKIITESFEL